MAINNEHDLGVWYTKMGVVLVCTFQEIDNCIHDGNFLQKLVSQQVSVAGKRKSGSKYKQKWI